MKSFSNGTVIELMKARKIKKCIEVIKRIRGGKSPRWRKIWNRDS